METILRVEQLETARWPSRVRGVLAVDDDVVPPP